MTTADPLPPGQPFPLPPILHHASSPPSLPWRHPTLDARLTRARILAEARILHKCHREGVPVPPVLALDEAAGWLMLEWVPGVPVRVAVNRWLQRHHPARRLPGIAEDDAAAAATQDDLDASMRTSVQADKDLADIMRRVGAAIGSLHNVGIVHGDLTTSNMMLRPPAGSPEPTTESGDTVSLEGDVVLIDFGLASVSNSDEDRAVDLYVLERAFGSTHPRAEVLFDELLAGYKQGLPAKQATVVLRKLEDVRMRGRKRSMVG
ncbi:serine/threonine-protein kinase BUD32 [Plectosphaerella cucumerina]|uniref:EKC/KEOPS complex subunit BUD32 n=1 Tax=Plectosphaerella cucumerina TaxID=40658 RepID=A0A8K0X8N6_9PEZI|nr:serine/threonine-protein kinase BUD32 [Plectosphaerella cucumerina]